MPVLSFIPPMMPTLVDEAPEGGDWQHEIKYDGYRTQLLLAGDQSRAWTRNGHDWTDKYRPILVAGRSLPCEAALLDGEVVVADESGRTDFGSLRATIMSRPTSLTFMAFDLLDLDGVDLRRQPLLDRRARLMELIRSSGTGESIQFSDHIVGNGAAMFAEADRLGLEGIVSKRIDSRYRSGTTLSWLKVKCFAEGEFVVIGTEYSKGQPASALLAREDEGGLTYMGGAMVTLPAQERDRFWAEMERLTIDRPALPIRKRKSSSWVRPELRVSVRFLKGEEKLRHATLVKLLPVTCGS